MQKKSANNSKAENAKPRFKSKAEEAEWLSSPAGRRVAERRFVKAMREGKVIVTDRRTIDEKDREALRAGAVIRYKNGLEIKPTDPAVLQALMDSVNAKKTQAVSLRIPVSDIEAAKKLAAKMGLGYQTLLKEIISKALHNAL